MLGGTTKAIINHHTYPLSWTVFWSTLHIFIVFSNVYERCISLRYLVIWASYQIRKIASCACAGNAGNVLPRHRGLAIPTCITARACNDSAIEIRHDTRCWAPYFALDMTGMTRHHCILTCRIHRDCQFLNYQLKEGRCQLASVCVVLYRVTGVAAVLFGKLEQPNECVNWIPATEFGNSRGFHCNQGTGYVARLITEKYIIIGRIQYPTFKGAYYNGSGAPTVVETTDLDGINFFKCVPGCRCSWNSYRVTSPMPSINVQGDWVYINDGVLAPLCVACADTNSQRKSGYYNSITKKTYYVDDNIVNITSNIRLLYARYL